MYLPLRLVLRAGGSDSDHASDGNDEPHIEVKGKSPKAALIGGLVGGLAGLLMLVYILWHLWRTRGSSRRGAGTLPITRTASASGIMHSNSDSTTRSSTGVYDDERRPRRKATADSTSAEGSKRESKMDEVAVDQLTRSGSSTMATPGRSTPVTVVDEKVGMDNKHIVKEKR